MLRAITASAAPPAMGKRDLRVDQYIDSRTEALRPVLVHLRARVHAACPDVEETIKWGMPHFIHRGRILGHMAGFKAHAAFGFWHGHKVLQTGREGEAMGQFGRFVSIADLPAAATLEAFVAKAAALIDAEAPRQTRRRVVRADTHPR
jgi:hypothetical protein